MIILFLGQILQMILAVLQIRLATTLLDPAQYGTWILIQTTVGFCVMFSLSPLGLYLNRHVIGWEKNQLMPEVFRTYTGFLLFFSFLSFIFFILIQKIKIIGLSSHSILITAFVMSFLLLTQTFYQTWLPTLNFFGKRKEYVAGSLLGTLLGLMFVLFFAKIGWKSAESWSAGVSIGFFIATVLFIPQGWYKFNRERFLIYKDSIKLKEVFHFSMPLFFSTLFMWTQTQGFRFIIGNQMGIAILGQFAAGYAVVAGLFSALESVISNFYQPRYFHGINSNGNPKDELKQVWDIALYPYFLAAAFLFLLAPSIAKIFLNRHFLESSDWISWVVISEGMRVLFNLVCIHFHGTKKTSTIVLPHLAGIILSFSLMFFKKKLSFVELSIFLGSGYLLSIILLFFADYKNYVQSNFLFKLIKSAGASAIYLIMGFVLTKSFNEIFKLIFISLLGGVFITPYYLKNIRNSA